MPHRCGSGSARRVRRKPCRSLDALNLFDSRSKDMTYFYESRLPGETEPVADIHFHALEPRQFRLTLRGTF